MSKHLTIPLTFGFLVVTPLLAAEADEDPVVAEANQEKARAEAQKAKYEAQKAAAEARLAPLSQFAGKGSNEVNGNGGAMEGAYLAAISIRDAANAINRNVFDFVESAPASDGSSVVLDESAPGWARNRPGDKAGEEGDAVTPEDLLGDSDVPLQPSDRHDDSDKIILLTDSEALSFDAVAAFDTEARGLIRASVRALQVQGASCPARPAASGGNKNFLGIPGALPTIGSVIGLLQSDTTVYDMGSLGDSGMLATALMAGRPGAYIRHDNLLASEPSGSDPVVLLMDKVAVCDEALRAAIKRLTPNKAKAEQVGEMNRAAARIEAFNSRMTTPAADGKVPLATVLRQSALKRSSSPYVLRIKVNRAGGTMLKRKNLLTAIGAPPFTLSGGVISEYALSDRTSGVVVRAGSVVCRTRLTGLHSAMRLRDRDIVCAENPPRRTAANRPGSSRGGRPPSAYQEPIYRLPDPVPMPLD